MARVRKFDLSKNEERFTQAQKFIPGGVNSPVRAFKGVGGTPVFMAKGEGAYLYDVDGNPYLDFVGSWGPLILGHNPESVRRQLQDQLSRGTSYGAPTVLETELAEEIVNRIEGVEMLRLVNSGTEATMSAIRLARGFSGKEIIIKFIGNYHGHGDSFLIQGGSGMATLGTPSSPGVLKSVAEKTIAVEYNSIDAVEKVFQEHEDNIAAVIVEPVAGNMGCVAPREGFLEGLRQFCTDHSSLLIFDEVMTGFRLSRGGASERFQVIPDLFTFGKVIGGGLPVGAYGGRKDIMERISPRGDIYQAGTLSGNPLAVTAGLATLKGLTDEAYAKLEELGQKLEAGIGELINTLNAPWSIQRVGSMFTLFFNPVDKAGIPPTNFAEVQGCDMDKFASFFHKMLSRGFYLPPSGYESWFLNTAMINTDLDLFLENAEAVFVELV